jgi:hypothetical protein
MKKLLSFVFVVLFASLLLLQISCSSDDRENNQAALSSTTYPISGLWIGTYTAVLSDNGPLFYSFVIYPDGTIVTKGEMHLGVYAYSTGTWTLTGDTFTAVITTMERPFFTQQITGTFSNTGVITDATWEDIESEFPFNSGEFSTMERIN